MSLPVNPTVSQPRIVSLPQVQKIVQDVTDCVHQLKEDFVETRTPINDDSQVLQRFCAKLEHLLQYEMKERYSLLGKRKEYWDYFCECLGSTRGSNDGVKYVKSLGENKTALGKGRSFIRFALVHQRLADSIQQCVIHPKTSEWYNASSVWMQPKVSSSIVSLLYDLNDLHFDLSPKGYDLDNAWPSFARKSSGSQNWNIPASRRSSITSMDTVSLSAASTNPEEISRLQQELASAETARSVLAETVGTLEQERQKAEQSVWMTQGELSAMQEQLRLATARNTELQQQLSALQRSQENLQAEKSQQMTETEQRRKQLESQQQQLQKEQERLEELEKHVKQQLEEERSRCAAQLETLQTNVDSLDEERDKLASKVSSLEESLERLKEWDTKKDQQIARLEQQASVLEQRNSELTEDMAKNLSTREQEAASQLDSARKYHDILSRLKEVETENVQLQASVAELQHKCHVSEENLQEERTKQRELCSRLESDKQKLESLTADLQTKSEDFENESKALRGRVDKMTSELESAQRDMERISSELGIKNTELEASNSRHCRLSSFVCQALTALLEVSGAEMKLPDISRCSETELSNFVDVCKKSSADRFCRVQSKTEIVEKEKASLLVEKQQLQELLAGILSSLPDKPDSVTSDLAHQSQEIHSRVQALCTQLSDLVRDRDFLKEQLQLAQGEHSDKGKQLSHLEGRLLELDKVLKESRASESSLQGQVASVEVVLKNEEKKCLDLASQLQAARRQTEEKADSLERMEAEKAELEVKVKDSEGQRDQLQKTLQEKTDQCRELKENIQNLEKTVAEQTQSLSAEKARLGDKDLQLTDLEKKVRARQEEKGEFEATILRLEEEKSSTIRDLQTVKEQLTESSSLVHTLSQELERERTVTCELSVQTEQLKSEYNRLQETLHEKQSELSSSKASHLEDVRKLEEEKSQMMEKVGSTQRELTQAEDQVSELAGYLQSEQSERERVSSEKQAVLATLEETRTLLQEKEMTFSEEIQSLQSQLDVYRAQKEELQKSAHSSEEEKSKVIVEKQTVIDDLEKAKSELEEQVEVLSEKNAVLVQDVEKVQAELADTRPAADQAQQLQHTKQLLEESSHQLKEEAERLSADVEQLKGELREKIKEVEEARLETDSLRSESERLRSDSASEKSELEDSLEKLQSRFSELQTSLDAVIKEKEDLSATQVTMQEEIVELKADLASSADGYNFLLQSSQKVQEEKEAEAELLKSQVSELEERKSQLSTQLEATSQERDSLQQQLHSSSAAKTVVEEKAEMLEKQAEVKTKEVDELKQLVQSLTNSVSVLEADDQSRRSELEQLQTSLKEKENYIMQVEALQQELSALQFQLSAEQLQHEESVKAMGSHESSLAEMSTRLADQETLIAHLEGELTSLKTGWEKERGNQTQQLDELKSLLKAKEMEGRQLHEMLQRKSDKLEETLSAAELYQKENCALRQSLDHDIEERESEIQTLRSDNEQLKKQLIKVVREKALLWQQTDELASEHKRKAGEKWLDNSLVTKCMGCSADFSLFLRKHHCRLCGRIFCWSCSDNWVDSPSSSRKARACKQCYRDLQSLDTSVAKASLLPEDSDEETTGSEAASRHSSQTDSRSTSSLQRATSPQTVDKQLDISPESSNDDIYSTANSNQQSTDNPSFTDPTCTSTPNPAPPPVPATASGSSCSYASASESISQDSAFQVITQEEVTKSVAAYDESAAPPSFIDIPNMSSSMLLSADDLATGQINRQSETWVKAGRSFAVPIAVDCPYTVVSWEFTVQPKDIQFSITYHYDDQQPVSQAETLVEPTRCNSVKEPVKGELMAKKPGIYTLVFDNSYSRMTAKKIHYQLQYGGVQ